MPGKFAKSQIFIELFKAYNNKVAGLIGMEVAPATHDKRCGSDRLSQVRDVFLFCSQTGIL